MQAWPVFLVLAVCLACSTAAHSSAERNSAEKSSEAQAFFDSIPDDEQEYFVSYSLALELSLEEENDPMDYTIKIPDDLHIPPDVLDNFESMTIPDGFTRGLYNWVRVEYSMGEHEVRVLAVKSEYCFPDGHCVDLNDVGNTCCPF